MTPSKPIPELVYDAALRTIAREPWPDDAETMAAWWKQRTDLSTRDLALEVIRRVAEHGYGRRCVD